MIRNSFIFLDKISHKKEENLWKNGISDWQDFLETKKIFGINDKNKKYFDRKIQSAKSNLYNLNSSYFCGILPKSEHWRLYDFFRDEVCFLDIETTGLSNYSKMTMVGLYDGITTKTMINGINLDVDGLKKELQKYKLIVTFNGATFDLPFLSKRYPALLPKIPHFDLRHGCKRIGLKGGLKQIEKELGIKRRNKIVEEMYGGDPVTLWRMFKVTNDDYYLNLLIEYNEEDAVNLKKIADYVYSGLKKAKLGQYIIESAAQEDTNKQNLQK